METKWFQGEIVGQEGMVPDGYKDPYYVNDWGHSISIDPRSYNHIKELVNDFLFSKKKQPVQELKSLFDEYSTVLNLPGLECLVVPMLGDVVFEVKGGKLVELNGWYAKCFERHLCGNVVPKEELARPCKHVVL